MHMNIFSISKNKCLFLFMSTTETAASIVPPPVNQVQNDDNQNSASINEDDAASTDQMKTADSSLSPTMPPPPTTASGNADAELLCTIAAQLRQVYADMLLNVVQQGATAAKELDSVQAQVSNKPAWIH